MPHKTLTTLVCVFAIVCGIAPPECMAAESAKDILDATGVKGGLVVHIGCGEGKLTAALRASESYLIHGLDTDAKNIRTARVELQISRQLANLVIFESFLPLLRGLPGKSKADRAA